MSLLKNILAIVGLVAIIVVIWLFIKVGPLYQQFSAFDPKALDTYMEMGELLLETGNAAEATIWRRQVQEGLTVEDVEGVMASVASELNIKNVGELPLSTQVELMTGEKQRFLKIYMYCNPLTAMKMVEHSDSYAAYLPCRVSLVEDKQGNLWVYALNMDMMIHGGTPLPQDLKEEAIRIRKVILDIMERAAEGDF